MGAFTDEQLKEMRNAIEASDANKDGVFSATEQSAFVDILLKSETAPYAAINAAWEAFSKGLADKDGDDKFTVQEVMDFFAAYEG